MRVREQLVSEKKERERERERENTLRGVNCTLKFKVKQIGTAHGGV
jgi:hypothetical protein